MDESIQIDLYGRTWMNRRNLTDQNGYTETDKETVILSSASIFTLVRITDYHLPTT